ncbi:MAG: hypothetical protein ACE5FG_02690 [Myxococcota bacterium]
MNLRERRVAQIVRDFQDAFVLSARIRDRLPAGDLDFAWIERLVGESEESTLYRLKEECHALFRRNGAEDSSQLEAEELLDLAVAALFHEAMKFRESFYLTTTYQPRLKRMASEGSASSALAEAFRRLFEAGRRRMFESETELANLFRETRDQLLIVLRQMPPSGAVARSLTEDPARVQAVFGMPLEELLDHVYGSARSGRMLAVRSLLDNGHFAEAEAVLADGEDTDAAARSTCSYAGGMARYYAGDVQAALEGLERWIRDGAGGYPEWRERARKVLESIGATSESVDPRLGRRALDLAETLMQLPRG